MSTLSTSANWGIDSDFMWHRFDDDHRTALCSKEIDCYYPRLGNPLLEGISAEHSLENGGSHCPTCTAFNYATDAQHFADVRFEQDGAGRVGWASTAPGRTKYHHYDAGKSKCSYQRQHGPLHFHDNPQQLDPKDCCSSCDLHIMKAASRKSPHLPAEVPRHANGGSEPYRWNENGVCTNPDYVYQAKQSTWDTLTLTAALSVEGRWRTGFDYNYRRGPGGSSSPVSRSGPDFATKEDAIKAQAAALLARPAIKDLHKNLHAALVKLAGLPEPAAPVAAPPAKKIKPAGACGDGTQLSLFA